MNPHGLKNVGERLTDSIRQHADVVRAHDAVHPDRNACGGVGGCAIMRAEHNAEEEVTDALDYAARKNVTLTVTATNRTRTEEAP